MKTFNVKHKTTVEEEIINNMLPVTNDINIESALNLSKENYIPQKIINNF